MKSQMLEKAFVRAQFLANLLFDGVLTEMGVRCIPFKIHLDLDTHGIYRFVADFAEPASRRFDAVIFDRAVIQTEPKRSDGHRLELHSLLTCGLNGEDRELRPLELELLPIELGALGLNLRPEPPSGEVQVTAWRHSAGLPVSYGVRCVDGRPWSQEGDAELEVVKPFPFSSLDSYKKAQVDGKGKQSTLAASQRAEQESRRGDGVDELA